MDLRALVAREVEDDTVCRSVLNQGQRIGLGFTAGTGLVSLTAVICFFALVARNAIVLKRWPIRTAIDVYMISLLLADLLQAFGAVADLRWIIGGTVSCSAFCAAQGALQQLGETSVAMSTLAITVHTFMAIFFRWNPSKRLIGPTLLVLGIWLYSLIFVLVGYLSHPKTSAGADQPFYVATPFWCWINSKYLGARIAGEYFWLWFTAAVNVVLYIPLFFYLRGNIDVDVSHLSSPRSAILSYIFCCGRRVKIKCHKARKEDQDFSFMNFGTSTNSSTEFTSQQQLYRREAAKMVWYSIAYSVVVLPITIDRWATFSSLSSSHTSPTNNPDPSVISDTSSLPFTVTGIVVSIFGLSGFVNTVLFLVTRPSLLLFGEYRRYKRNQNPSISPMTRTSFGDRERRFSGVSVTVHPRPPPATLDINGQSKRISFAMSPTFARQPFQDRERTTTFAIGSRPIDGIVKQVEVETFAEDDSVVKTRSSADSEMWRLPMKEEYPASKPGDLESGQRR
jgi:hypothetical protein